MAHIRLFSGPSRSGRARAVDDVLCGQWGQAALLVPTSQFARERTEQVLLERNLPGAWGSPVQTFQEFAAELLRSSGVFGRPVGLFERRLVLDRALRRVRAEGRLAPLGPAADTAGFASHVLRIVTQLKQAAIDPPQFRRKVAQRKEQSWLDEIVASVYDAYQSALQDQDAYDLVGVYWMAALACAQGRPPVFEGTRTILLDGFDDFTPSEFRLLKAVLPHIDNLVFGIDCAEDAPSQRDLYAVPIETAGRIRQDFGPVESESFPEPPPRSYVEFAATQVFWRSRPNRPDGLDANLELMPCATAVQEAEAVGRRVKSLIVDHGVSPDRIAVVYRDVDDVADLIAAVFHEFGIPLDIQHTPSVSKSAIGAFLLNFLDATQSWRREQVVDVIASPWYAPYDDTPPECRRAVPLLARMAGIVEGLAEWKGGLEHLRGRLATQTSEDEESLADRLKDPSAAANWMLAQVELLETLGRGVPGKGRLEDFVEGIATIGNLCRIEYVLDSTELDGVTREAEAAAYGALRALLARLRCWRAHGSDNTTLTRADFLALFRWALEDTPYSPRPRTRGVICVDPERIRHLNCDYVFYAGVNEKSVPRPPTASAIYTDVDVRDLRSVGVPVDDRQTHSGKEAILFHHVLEAARRRLCISWRTVSVDGRPMAPSPFVDDLRELFAGLGVESPPPRPDAYVPAADEAASWRDLCNVACCMPESGLIAVLDEKFPEVGHGVAIETRRQGRAPFDQYDGVLSAPQAVEAIAARYGPAHQFSASQAETYAECPFRFFVGRVLGVEDIEAPSNEFDARERGSIMHEILQRFHSMYRGRPAAALPADEANSRMLALVAEVFGRRAQSAPRGVVAAERYRMTALMLRYLAIAREKDGDWAPVHFETAFGAQKGPEGEPPSTPEPYAMETPAGPVLFAGRIDRIDEGPGGLRIIDYKTSIQAKPKSIKAGVSMQLGIYALAVEGLLRPDAVCAEARFLQAGTSNTVEALGRNKKPPEWEDRQNALREKAGEVVRGIREGRFPPDPYGSDCGYCPFRPVCRYEPARVQRKKRGAL